MELQLNKITELQNIVLLKALARNLTSCASGVRCVEDQKKIKKMKKLIVKHKKPSDDGTRKIASEFGCKVETAKRFLSQNQITNKKAYLALLQRNSVFKAGQIQKLLFFDRKFAAGYVRKHGLDTSEIENIP